MTPSPQRVRRASTTWAVGSAVGAAVVALPDDGPRLVSLSRTHGPSLLDAGGILVLLAAWVPVLVVLWAGRALLAGRPGGVPAALGVVGAVVLVASVAGDTGAEWVVGALLLLAAQVLALAVVARRAPRAAPPGARHPRPDHGGLRS